MGSIDFGTRGNRFILVLNPSNSKGDAFLAVTNVLRGPASNSILVGKAGAHGVPVGSGRGLHLGGVNFILRSRGLMPCLAISRRFRLMSGIGGARGLDRGRLRGLLRSLRVSGLVSGCPGRLSKNRVRHTTVTHTLCTGPRVVLTSRPATTLSAPQIGRINGLLDGLTRHRGGTIVAMARSLQLLSRTSEICSLGSKGLGREWVLGTPGVSGFSIKTF